MKRPHFLSIVAAFVALLIGTLAAGAAGTVVVTPAHPQGWYRADMRAGGAVNYVADATSPYPAGALQLITNGDNASKAQYLKNAGVPLALVTELSYHTKQQAGPAVAAPSFQLVVSLNGDGTGFTTLVYEPYWNGTVTPAVWQQWDVDAGRFWSSRTVPPLVVSGAGGPPFYSLAAIKAAYPNAVVLAFGVNVGTYNPLYNVATDGVNFNGTTYDFELANLPATRDQCKRGGWQNYTDALGNPFKNQGDCVSYVATGGKSK